MQTPAWTIQEQTPNGYWVRVRRGSIYRSEASAVKAAREYANERKVRAMQVTKIDYDDSGRRVCKSSLVGVQ